MRQLRAVAQVVALSPVVAHAYMRLPAVPNYPNSRDSPSPTLLPQAYLHGYNFVTYNSCLHLLRTAQFAIGYRGANRITVRGKSISFSTEADLCKHVHTTLSCGISPFTAREQLLPSRIAKGVCTAKSNFGSFVCFPWRKGTQFPGCLEDDEGRPSWPPWSLHVVLRSAAGSTSVKSVSSLWPKAGIRVVSSSE